jgi:hypothetical protein
MSDSVLMKLPEELKIIIPYITSLRNEIAILLKSNENEFEHIVIKTQREFSKYALLVGLALKDSNIKQLIQFYSSFSSQFKDKLSGKNTIALPINNANEIIADYFRLSSDAKINIFAEYPEAFATYLDVAFYCTVLIQAIENKNANQNIVSKLIKRCQENTWKLEGYVSTIEIETDPEQRAILERVQGQ